MIDPALPPQNNETFRFPKCLAATARRSVNFFPYPVGRTAKTYRPAAVQSSKHPNVWGLALNLENRVFKSKTQHAIELNVCTAHMKNKSDLEHAQLTRGFWPTQSYFARSRFLLSFPLPPPPIFCPRTAKTRSGDEINFSEKSTAGEYTKEGENICPPNKIIYMKYLLILLGRMFLTLKHSMTLL